MSQAHNPSHRPGHASGRTRPTKQTHRRFGLETLELRQMLSGVTVSATPQLITREGGAATTFTVALDTQPTADVSIPLSSSNLAEGTVSASSLLFTLANWNAPQAVSVTGVTDGVQDGDIAYSVVLGAATSADLNYSGLDPADVPAVNLDNTFTGFVYAVNNSIDTSGNDLLQRVSLQGDNRETLIDMEARFGGDWSAFESRYLDFDQAAGKVYWTEARTNMIRRANLDGSNAETVISGLGSRLRGIALDTAAGKIYWSDLDPQKLHRANLDGSGMEDLVSGLIGVREIALDRTGGKIYWANTEDHTIGRANLDGSNVEVLWSGSAADLPVGIALDAGAGKVYWTDYGSDRILRANLDGSNPESLIDLSALSAKDSRAYAISIDARAGKLYFSDSGNEALYRANLDGSNVVPIAYGITNGVQGIGLLTPSATVSPSAGLLTSESGGKATFQVSLNVAPRANVTIPVSSSNTLEGIVSASSLTFTTANWNVPQTVTVTGVDDALVDGNKSYSVVLGAASSTDANYAGVNPIDVSLVNRDNETKFLVVDDASANLTYRYSADGASRGNSSLTSADSAPRGVASSITGDKSWVIDANRTVYVYGASGGLLGSWTAGSLANNATPEGIATNGTDVWIVDSRSDKVYRYNGAASRLSGTQTAASSFSLNSGNADSTDIVTDAASLWVTNNSSTDKVFKYSLAGSLLGSWTIDAANKAPTGITIDPLNVSNIWIVDSGTDKVYQYSGAATRTSGSQAAALSWALASGDANPQGIADPPSGLGKPLSASGASFAWDDAALGAALARIASPHSAAADEAAHDAVWAHWH